MEIFRDELAKAEWVKIRFRTSYGVRVCYVYEVGLDAARLALHSATGSVSTPLVVIIPLSEIVALEVNG